MKPSVGWWPLFFLLAAFATISISATAQQDETKAGDPLQLPAGWRTASPREEIQPAFDYDPVGGPQSTGSFVIRHDPREGLDGRFEKEFAVDGGSYYRFTVLRRLTNVTVPRRSALVRIRWQDDAGKMVSANVSPQQIHALGHTPSAEPEHPSDGTTDGDGWTTVNGLYRAPLKATRAVVELHLQWAPSGIAEWSEVEFTRTSEPQPRRVRLAAIHYRPTGKSPRANIEEFAPSLAEAARQRADLVVLGETIPYVSVGKPPADVAESIPGPTTDFFGELAKKHQFHLVFSLYERDQHLIYNTAVLLGPNGSLLGKYRKVCLPHAEVESGVAPGNDYPVFETRLGTIGLMVCYDGFFPEVARELSNRGAEIIAWPVWGCNPKLAAARACENHVFVVSSTYMRPEDEWMISAVYDQSGTPIATTGQSGGVAIAEVDLGQPFIGPWNLGDFRAMIPRHRPVAPFAVGEVTDR